MSCNSSEKNTPVAEPDPVEDVKETPINDEGNEKVVETDGVIAVEEVVSEESQGDPQSPRVPELIISEAQSIEIVMDENSGTQALEEYVVKLAVDEAFKLHQKGDLKVWIGADSIEVSFGEGMAQDETTVPADVGQYARVEPRAPDFDISPEVVECVKIHPSGSEVRFTLTPKTSGDFSVSADIKLFSTDDCTGTPVPRSAKSLTVQVTVDNKHVFKSRLSQMGEVVWDKFFSFWGALVTLLFGAALFVIRRYVRNKTGYSEES